MGEWMKWMCYMDVAIVLILSAYAGIIKKNATRREKVFNCLWIVWGILGFFIIEFVFNDKFYVVPKTFLLVLLAWILFIMFSRGVERKYYRVLFVFLAITCISYIVSASVGGPGIEVYTRDEVTNTVSLVMCYNDKAPTDAWIPDGIEDDDYIFQIDDVLYYYINDKKPIKQHISVKNVKWIISTKKEAPSIKWHAKKSYYKSLKWGKEIEKEAPAFLVKPPEPYVEIFMPKESWKVKSSISVTGD